jgi:hypothetical protein
LEVPAPLLEKVVEKEVVKEGLVAMPQERRKEDMIGQDTKEETVVEEIAKQPPTGKGNLLFKLRELKKKVSSHLPCIS